MADDLDPPGGGGICENGRRGDRGAAIVEYTMLLALIAIVCILSVSALGDAIDDSIRDANPEVSSSDDGSGGDDGDDGDDGHDGDDGDDGDDGGDG